MVAAVLTASSVDIFLSMPVVSFFNSSNPLLYVSPMYLSSSKSTKRFISLSITLNSSSFTLSIKRSICLNSSSKYFFAHFASKQRVLSFKNLTDDLFIFISVYNARPSANRPAPMIDIAKTEPAPAVITVVIANAPTCTAIFNVCRALAFAFDVFNTHILSWVSNSALAEFEVCPIAF